jgi:hypothetical protein
VVLVFELLDDGLPPHAESANALAASRASRLADSLRRAVTTAEIARTSQAPP